MNNRAWLRTRTWTLDLFLESRCLTDTCIFTFKVASLTLYAGGVCRTCDKMLVLLKYKDFPKNENMKLQVSDKQKIKNTNVMMSINVSWSKSALFPDLKQWSKTGSYTVTNSWRENAESTTGVLKAEQVFWSSIHEFNKNVTGSTKAECMCNVSKTKSRAVQTSDVLSNSDIDALLW